MKRTVCGSFVTLCLFVAGYATHIGGRTAAADLTPKAGDGVQPLITTSELVVGPNRFAFGLLRGNTLLEGADVTVRVYAIEASTAHVVAEVKAPHHAVRHGQPGHTVHQHGDGTIHVHGDAWSVQGLYVAQISFARAGTWGIELLAREANSAVEPVRFAVTVLETPATPAIGSAAPRSRNLIGSDVKDLREIDTSPTPDARLHQVRIVDAIHEGKPQLIVFATPQFCASRMCGPVVDIVRALLPTYGKRVAFTHQEFWQDFATKKVLPTVEEWRLETEPWIFVVDGQGVIRAKFEGLVTVQEIERVLQQVVP